jgi:glycosyltransferase involved in cell wall biosynthesis
VCRELLATGYFHPKRVRIIANGVAITPEDPAVRARVRSEFRLGDEPVLLATSRLHPTKGHRDLLAAVAQLRQTSPRVRLLLVGDGVERPHLEEQARGLGLGDAVRFTGFRDDVTALLQAADLFVLPSLREGMPNAALEAMAAGLPIVACAVDGVPEAVADGETGLLVPPGSPDALADALGRLLADRARAERLGRAGRDRARERFALDRVLAETEACCLETRNLRRRPAPGA